MSTLPHDDAWLMLKLYATSDEEVIIDAILRRIPEDDRYPYDGPRETLDEFAEWWDVQMSGLGYLELEAVNDGAPHRSMDEAITAYRASRTGAYG